MVVLSIIYAVIFIAILASVIAMRKSLRLIDIVFSLSATFALPFAIVGAICFLVAYGFMWLHETLEDRGKLEKTIFNFSHEKSI